MRSATEDRISSYAALCLFGSFLEMLIPHPLPFLRLGLANIPLMLALGRFGLRDYIILLIVKAASSSYISGTLFSYFFLISLAQSLVSGMVMYTVSKAGGRRISFYGISMAGSLTGTATQLLMASLYLGRGIGVLSGIFFTSSFVFSLITARLAVCFNGKTVPDRQDGMEYASGPRDHLVMAQALLSVFFIQITDDIAALAVLAAFLLAILHLYGRRIRLMPYILLFAFSLISNLIIKRGMVVATVFGFEITQESLRLALDRATRLSATVMLGLLYSRLFIAPGIVGRTLLKFFFLQDALQEAGGSLKERIDRTLSAPFSQKEPQVPPGAFLKGLFPLAACCISLLYSFLH